MATPFVFGLVLAGGEGKRLAPLTADRAKPAVPFGGNYRLIDFALSNLVNAGYLRIVVLTQYKSHSLDRHISTTWRLSPLLRNYVTAVPAQMRRGPHWFAGSADAIYQNLNLLHDERPDYVCVFGADHIYRMDPRQMVDQHIESGAGVTVAGIRVPIEQASEFGVIEPGADGRTIRAFLEKPTEVGWSRRRAPSGLRVDGQLRLHHRRPGPGRHGRRRRRDLQARHRRQHDPGAGRPRRGSGLRLHANEVPGVTEREHSYWRDVGTLDAYYDAHMDLISVDPVFDLYNREWPIHTWPESLPPAKFLFQDEGRTGHALDSMVCAGVIVSGAAPAPLDPLARGAPALFAARSRARSSCTGSTSAAVRSSGTRSSTRTSASPRARRSASTSSETASASSSRPAAIVVIAKGETVER